MSASHNNLMSSPGTLSRGEWPIASVLEHIIYAASLAPSPDNRQPWSFEIQGNSLLLSFEKSRGIQWDQQQTLNHLSLGCLLENLQIQARHEGYETQIQVLESNGAITGTVSGSIPVAQISFSKSKDVETNANLVRELRTRFTDWSSYSQKKLDASFLTDLQLISQGENKILIADDGDHLRALAQAFEMLDEVLNQNQTYQKDSRESLRSHPQEAAQKRDGLDLRSVSSGSWIQKLQHQILKPSRIQQNVRRQIQNSGAVGFLFVPNKSLPKILLGGMILERAWLTAERHGISFQTLPQLQVLDWISGTSAQQLTASQVQKIQDAKALLQTFFHLHPDLVPCAAFRLGYAQSARPLKSIRRLPSQILKARPTSDFDYDKAFCRNLGLISKPEQEVLKNMTVGLPGMGGVGSHHLMALARLGIGGFRIADADTFSVANFNRQYGATVSSVDQSKVEIMKAMVQDVNPDLRLKTWNSFIDETNVVDFMRGCDLIIDCVDAYNVEARRIIFNHARKLRIPVISTGPIGFSTAMVIFTPDGYSFEKYIDYNPNTDSVDHFAHFIMGMTPRPYFVKYMQKDSADPTAQTGPSVATSVFLCAGFAGVEAVKYLLGRMPLKGAPHYYYFDPYLMKFKKGYIPFGNRNWIQKLLISIVKKRMIKK